MCGIAAIWGQSDPETVRSMLDRLQHRGPDGRATHDPASAPRTAATLGHSRLAIIDPEGGRQPLVASEATCALVCNGMIYNDRDLRRRLDASRFLTGSDSESILRGFIEHGPGVVRELDGMFAFLLVDTDGHAFAARDPLGIKPLYMGEVDGSLAFASEIKALAPVADNIREFPAGHTWDSRHGFRRYYRVPGPRTVPRTEVEAAELVRTRLEAAVHKRLRSDVPLGAFLSGGLDSSIIAAIAREHVDELHTFAVGLAGSSDLVAARRVAEHLDTVHHEHVITTGEVEAVLPGILHHLESYDRDLVRSAVPTWFVARLAARYVKVVLTGEGADELFAGYGYYGEYADDQALQAETRRCLQTMHNVNLQRVDRMTMAHSLEARVPFLDTAMIELAMELPAEFKLRRGETDGAKWILRRAFEDRLPPEIVWRRKLQFDEGSGFSEHLAACARRVGTHGGSSGDARSVEEGVYRRLLAGTFDEPERVLGLTAHWSEDRVVAPRVAA
ncbi:MAG: asparagine synthase B [Halofilum sp. (in: g-proteobacteria)]|nr:asparagine synthase B [Halofilum sp. (in: g-proteobacteria)]